MMGAFVEKLFMGILNMSVTASIVILAVLLVRVFLRKLPRIFSYLLWMVVLFRLLCPFSFEADFSLLRALPVSTQEQGDLTYAPMQSGFFESVNVTPDMDMPLTEPTVETIAGTQEGETTVTKPVDVKEIAVSVVSVIWLVGAGSLLVYSVVTLFRLKGKLKAAEHVQDNIYTTRAVETPFVIGVAKPKIYLPAQLLEDEKSYILMHEQIHIKRGDHIVKIISFLALCLHWFNPLVWLSFFLLGKDMEMSCDEAVIRKAGSGVKKEYSSSLLSLATGRRIVNGVPLAFGEGDTGSRIKNVLKYKKPATIVAVIALVVCVVVAVVLLANPSKQNPDAGNGTNVADDDSSNVVDEDGSNATDYAAQPNEVLYGVVTDVEFEGSVRRLLVIPRMGEIEIPSEAEIQVNVERESKELEAGDLVEIAFAPGESVSVLETWPGRFATDAETITVLWQDCGLVYEGDDTYQFTFAADVFQDSENIAVDDTVMIYREEENEPAPFYKTYVLRVEESADGKKLISVRISTFGLEGIFGELEHIRFAIEKPEPIVLGENAEGTYQVNLRSIDLANRSIDSYVSDYQSTYEGAGPLYFAEDCVFKTNSEFWKYDFKEVSFEEFAELLGEEDSFLNQPCLCTFENNKIVEICLLSTWNAYGIKADATPPANSFYEYVMEEEGEEVFEECYSLVRTETADIADTEGEETIEIYAGNLGDGVSGFVLFKDAAGNLLYVQDAHAARAGWNNIYVGENEDGAFILNVYVEDRWDYGGYGYWAYRLDEDGEVRMIAGSSFDFDLGENSNCIYDDELFAKWVAPMEEYLADSHLLLSTQEGEVRTEAVSELDKYNYGTLNLSGR